MSWSEVLQYDWGSGSSSGALISTNASICSFSIPSRTPTFILLLQVAVGTVCVLSILGSALIIFTFVFFRDLRTTARHFLANLSVADCIIAASHLIGLFANYRRFLCDAESSEHDVSCTLQAAATMFGTLAAFAWTLAIAVYMWSIVVLRRKAATWSIVLSYAVCWGVPAAMVIGYGAAGYFGFDEGVDIGWCYLRRIDYVGEKNRNPFPHILAYELWTHIIFVILPILYIWAQCYIKIKIKNSPIFMDIKLLFVPILFLLLRVWNFILDCFILYSSDEWKFKESKAAAAFIFMSGIGDSAQGIVNAVLFIGFTRVVRRRLVDMVRERQCGRCHKEEWTVLQETDELTRSISTNQPGAGEKGEDDDGESSSLVDSDSLEGIRVLKFQSSLSSYGTTTSRD